MIDIENGTVGFSYPYVEHAPGRSRRQSPFDQPEAVSQGCLVGPLQLDFRSVDRNQNGFGNLFRRCLVRNEAFMRDEAGPSLS